MPPNVFDVRFTAHYIDHLPTTRSDLNAFINALDNGLLDEIIARNPDLTELSIDPNDDTLFVGALHFEGPVINALFDRSGGDHALGAIVERILWVPPQGPRIAGTFEFSYERADGVNAPPFSGGGTKGGT